MRSSAAGAGWGVAALAGLAALYVLTIRIEPTTTAGDFALYLMHAQNMAALKPYAATGFVFNPANAFMSPAAYPPGLPLLLAPWVALAGLDMAVITPFMVLLCLAMLACLYGLARQTMAPRWAALVVIAAGLSPALLRQRDTIGSDVPFTFWCYLALLVWRTSAVPTRAWVRGIVVAGAVAMALLTRSIGIVLVAALALDLVWHRGPGWVGRAAALLLGGGVAVAVTLLVRVDNATYLSYFDRLQGVGLLSHLAGLGMAYAQALVELFGLSFGRLANLPVLGGLVLLIVAGLARRLWRGAGAVDLFVLLYAAALVAYPVHAEATRYALPILPLLLLMLVDGVASRPRVARHPALGPAVGLAVLVLLYGPYFMVHNPWRGTVNTPDEPGFGEMVEALRATPPDVIVLGRNPRVLTLYGQRRAVTWPERLTEEGFWETVARFGPGLLVEEAGTPTEYSVVLAAILAANPQRLRPVFGNARYRIWAIATPAPAPGR